MTECIPSDIENEGSRVFLRDLCSLAIGILNRGTGKRRNGSILVPILNFAEEYVNIFGGVVEETTLCWVSPSYIQLLSSSSGEGRACSVRNDEVCLYLQSVIFAIVAGMEGQLVRAWTPSQRQGNGQPAFETKTMPAEGIDSPEAASTAGLGALFSFLTVCTEICPHFLMHMPAKQGADDDDLLLLGFLGLAVTCIADLDTETSKRAMEFLDAVLFLGARQTLTELSPKSPVTNKASLHTLSLLPREGQDLILNKQHQQLAEECHLRIKPRVLKLMLTRMCGTFPFGTLHLASKLLRNLCIPATATDPHFTSTSCSVNQLREFLYQGLSPDIFLLGDVARRIVVDVCLDAASAVQTMEYEAAACKLEDLVDLVSTVWKMHHCLAESATGVLRDSDLAVLFCKIYTRE